MNRSSTTGIPRERFPFPPGFGMSTLFTGWGMYVPVASCSLIRDQCSLSSTLRSSTVFPSIPGTPLFARSLCGMLLTGSRGAALSPKASLSPVGMSPLPLRTLDAPCPYPKRFRLFPSGSPPVSQPSCLRLSRPSRLGSLPLFHVRAFASCTEVTMPSADFWPVILPLCSSK